ncbi:hypothetical protein [Kamptonema sp. UHCC 0994]|uniref:hypothetical protein n=1 Tax=Kamptonema sp. UHCC 0994 TaxID=3031329 RepID=UPI0023BA05B4|nr:hypothetical protein [Kamptonema sp. UHCC 0994]MDF0556036.1 hypothetical protein [Kamptonema sp. UHCC 0994]
MAINRTGKKTLSQGRRNSGKTEEVTANEAVTQKSGSVSQVMALTIRDKTMSDRKQPEIQLYHNPLPENRPIGTNDFEVFDTIRNRPIESSSLEVIEIVDNRPVMADNFEVMEMYSEAGNRPVGSSALQISELYSVMGANRPIASNIIDDSFTLMGFID